VSKRERRFVLDANVLVSAALFKQSKPRQALDKVLELGCLLLSDAVLSELEEVFFRPKFDRYLSSTKRVAFLENLVDVSLLVDIISQINDCRDPKDNKYLELAISGDAEHLISGDNDLLVLNPFRGISIITPQSFLDSL
jgi:uncharacterized protein